MPKGYVEKVKTFGMTVRGAKPQDLLASVVLVVEALYFIIATAIITGFGVVYAQGNIAEQGLLGTASLPLIAVGAFAVWSLALLHVLPPVPGVPNARVREGAGGGGAKMAAQVGFMLVVLTHGGFGLLLLAQGGGLELAVDPFFGGRGVGPGQLAAERGNSRDSDGGVTESHGVSSGKVLPRCVAGVLGPGEAVGRIPVNDESAQPLRSANTSQTMDSTKLNQMLGS